MGANITVSIADLQALIRPLTGLIQRLGLTPLDWHAQAGAELVEQWDLLKIGAIIQNSAARMLSAQDLNNLKGKYGAALIEFYFAEDNMPGAWQWLKVDDEITDDLMQRFQEEIAGHDPYLVLIVDKKLLLQLVVPELLDDWHMLLFFYHEALVNMLCNRVDLLEPLLWPTIADNQGSISEPRATLLLVPAIDLLLTSSFLTVAGGHHLSSVTALISKPRPDTAKTEAMVQYRRDHIRWQKTWVNNITPQHFYIPANDDIDRGDGTISRLLDIHFVTLSLLFTAEQTDEFKYHMVSTYIGASHRAAITIPRPSEAASVDVPESSLAYIFKIVESIYDPIWIEKGRGLIPIVQSAVSERMEKSPPDSRFFAFIESAATLEENIELHWQSVFEDKLTAYFSQVKTLQAEIASTITNISANVAEVTKGLSDAVLAAIATVVGSFIGALFAEKFRPIVFATGLILYGVYVYAFPLIFGLSTKRESYEALVTNYDVQRETFKELLTEKKVADIEGNRIEKQKQLFEKWFHATVITYLIIGGLAFYMASQAVDPNGIITNIVDKIAPLSTPTPVHTATIATTPTTTVTITATNVPTTIPTSAIQSTPTILPAPTSTTVVLQPHHLSGVH